MQARGMDSNPQESSPPEYLSNSREPIQFDWHNRWLKGHEYQFILDNVENYTVKFGFEKFAKKSHPSTIYQHPINGTMYFVEGSGLGSEFGFPRIQGKKKYRWKKMNFSTNLPKKHPRVTYIVASTTNCQQIDDSEKPLFRMHAVIPYFAANRPRTNYILCHILEINKKGEPREMQHCFNQSNKPNFYHLFAFLHNFGLKRK